MTTPCRLSSKRNKTAWTGQTWIHCKQKPGNEKCQALTLCHIRAQAPGSVLVLGLQRFTIEIPPQRLQLQLLLYRGAVEGPVSPHLPSKSHSGEGLLVVSVVAGGDLPRGTGAQMKRNSKDLAKTRRKPLGSTQEINCC